MQSQKIMVIDDEPLIVQVACKQLRAAGFLNVHSTTDSKNALTEIRELRPDLVLLDMVMPDVSGIDILESLRDDPEIAQTLVLVLSAARKDVRDRAMQLGVTGFVSKPITGQMLIERVESLIGKAEAHS